MQKSFLLLFIIFISFLSLAQEGSLRGFVVDSTSGETLVFCNLLIEEIQTGASTNERGLFFIKSIPAGKEFTVTVSYVGYKTKKVPVFIKTDEVTQLNIELVPLSIELQTIEKVGDLIIKENNTDLSLERISVKDLEILPKGVETDIFRSLQNIAGVSSTGDVTARYYVRGGNGDQNLILVNGVELYNPFHSLGLFSVIDPEMINSLEFYKGGFSSEYSGRLSSVMRIISKDGNKNKFGIKGSGSFLTVKGLLEGPLPNGSFILTGRKSYNNEILKKILDKNEVPVNFYDYSFKLNYQGKEFFENAKFSLFGLSSNDVVEYDDPLREKFNWSNSLIGFEWIQLYRAPVFSRIGISFSNFEGEIIPNSSSLKQRENELSDFTLKFDLTAVFENKDEMDAGLQIKTVRTSLLQENKVGAFTDFKKFGGNISLYGKYRFLRYKNFGVDIGSRFNATGLNEKSGGIFEPRLSMTYRLIPSVAFKAAWGIYLQHLVTITDEEELISVFDPWMIIPDYLNPSRSVHYNAGIDIELTKGINFSAEVYYKTLKDVPVINDQKYFSSDPDFISSDGEGYGWEFAFKYGINPLNVTATYTLSWVYKNINDWVYYPGYDNRHALNVMLEMNLGNGWVASSVFNYNSGYPFTELLGFYDKYFPNNFNQSGIEPEDFSPYLIFGDRNLGRLPVYHRLDLSVIKRIKLFFTDVELGLSAINIYNRKNLFYYDKTTGKEVNMLPFLLTGTMKIEI